jgi:hypothetical protein
MTLTFNTPAERSAYLAAANVAARQAVLARRPRRSAPANIPPTAERAKQVLAVLVECGAIDPDDA